MSREGNSKIELDELELRIVEVIDPMAAWSSIEDLQRELNIFKGNVITDGSGTAIVTMPDWFDSLDRDLRYQLTVIGHQFAQATSIPQVRAMNISTECLFPQLALALLLVPSFGAVSQTVSSAPISVAAATAPTVVPALVAYSGTALNAEGNPLSGEASITFLIFKDQTGGEPLFAESQTVTLDPSGHYKVNLGATLANGLPSDLFSTGEARWLEVQAAGQVPQPRVLLVSVPYALKAADAATLGGLPASAFALAGINAVANMTSAGVTTDAASTVTTTGGTANKVAKFSGSNTIVNSILYDNGTEVGIGTTSPSATLTVDGTMTVDGTSIMNGQIQLPAVGTATASKAYNSQFIKLATSAYNSSSGSAIPPRFQLQAEAIGNDTASPNATLNLLASATSSIPTETGFYINTNGTIHFAPGQTFPGADITGAVNASSYDLGGTLFATGSVSSESAYLGFAGNTSSTGSGNTGVGPYSLSSNTGGYDNTAIGFDALSSNTTGVGNTASGLEAMYHNTTGGGNTASGDFTLSSNTTGIYNTASGYTALLGNTNGGFNTAVGTGALDSNQTGSYLTAVGYDAGDSDAARVNNATALGANAKVGQSNSLVLGQTTAANPGASYVNVGVGTATPRSALEVAVSAPNSLGPVLTLTNSGQGESAIDFNSGVPKIDAAYGPAARILASGSENAGQIVFQSRASHGLSNNLVVDGSGVHVPGALDAAETGLRIDHPADPANKYLVLSSVQSSEMMNIFTGNVVTDELGLATVKLPDWFEAENTDFRYQLTVIGQFAQAIIKDKIANGQFRIITNTSHVEVSWQITAVRQDPYAKAHPLVVEQQKAVGERGNYVHPELYGQPIDKQIGGHAHDQPASAVNKHFDMPPAPALDHPLPRPAAQKRQQ